ncbi:GNAT family N-acetyltransferase [Ideonella sp. YS5]|uniref:GNAT family N-acetyltransferase n=1 Tax=Ideonella sp. YS5 TaxID=3453714 RepID=UPI003EEB3384
MVNPIAGRLAVSPQTRHQPVEPAERNASVPRVRGYVLSPAVPSDAEEWSKFEVLPEFKRHTSSTVTSAEDLLALIARSASPDPAAPVYFVVREEVSRQMVASVGFHTISVLNRTAELTYGVRPDWWGRGLATSLCQAAVDWGFAQRAWVRLQATALESNSASQRVLQKSGSSFEGRLRNFRMVRGRPQDYLVYAVVPAVADGLADTPRNDLRPGSP